jgi:hypothetical protein
MSQGVPFWSLGNCTPGSDVETRARHGHGFDADGVLRPVSPYDAVEAISKEPPSNLEFSQGIPVESRLRCVRQSLKTSFRFF